jgi:CelD/BcsL family acetyltransferase involved in cellulose biosynthesis
MEAKCCDIFYRYLIDIQSQWDECDFQDIRAVSPLFKELINKEKTDSTTCNVCFFKVLDFDKKDILYQVPKKMRNNIRRALNKLNMAGEWEFIEENECRTKEALQDLFILHDARWKTKNGSGVLKDPNVQAFHIDSSEQMKKKNMLRIFSLKLKSKVIATYYVLLHRRRAYAYLSGFDPLMEDYSPGIVSLYCVIKELFNKGYDCIDFLRGEEQYKKYWDMSKSINYRLLLRK